MGPDKGGHVGKTAGKGYLLIYGGGGCGTTPKKYWKSVCTEVHSGAFLEPKSPFIRGYSTLYTELPNPFHFIGTCNIVLEILFN